MSVIAMPKGKPDKRSTGSFSPSQPVDKPSSCQVYVLFSGAKYSSKANSNCAYRSSGPIVIRLLSNNSGVWFSSRPLPDCSTLKFEMTSAAFPLSGLLSA